MRQGSKNGLQIKANQASAMYNFTGSNKTRVYPIHLTNLNYTCFKNHVFFLAKAHNYVLNFV